MSTAPPKESGPVTTGDRVSLYAFIVAGIIITAWIATTAVVRIGALVRGVDVPVLVEFVGQDADVEAGDAPVRVAIDSGTIIADTLPPVAIVPGILGQIALIVTVVVIVTAVILLSRSVLRGRVFSRRNTVLVVGAGVTGLVGFAAVRFFDSMLANATVSWVAPELSNALMTLEPFPFILAAFIIATIGSAFSIGDRLQRDTEGLI